MATYGSATNGQIPFTGWSPTLGSGAANVNSTSGAVQFNGYTQDDYAFARKVNFQANRAFRQVMYMLLGAAAGGTATAPYTRIRARQAMNDPFDMGGLQPIETVNYISRATAAADVTGLKALLDRGTGPATYPQDLSGNGSTTAVGGVTSKVTW